MSTRVQLLSVLAHNDSTKQQKQSNASLSSKNGTDEAQLLASWNTVQAKEIEKLRKELSRQKDETKKSESLLAQLSKQLNIASSAQRLSSKQSGAVTNSSSKRGKRAKLSPEDLHNMAHADNDNASHMWWVYQQYKYVANQARSAQSFIPVPSRPPSVSKTLQAIATGSNQRDGKVIQKRNAKHTNCLSRSAPASF